jgi:hypothetical protein
MLEKLTKQAAFVKEGYGQVEPNHLSAQRTGQIYAQLPTADGIDVLENGQFVKYDYANGVVNFNENAGEWMLVLNEIKLYRDFQKDCEFAMVRGNYLHEVYSPYDSDNSEKEYQSRFYGATNANGEANQGQIVFGKDRYELDATDNPFTMLTGYNAKKMNNRTAMVPRVIKTNIGDIFTTNTINSNLTKDHVGKFLAPNANGVLELTEATDGMRWQIVKFYTMPDGQPGVKIMRIA